ncbi:MAG: hypothetical protein U1A77_15075 [Pirellulales bacterium]
MATAVEGIVSVSYRPLATMDELHILLLAAVWAQTNDLSLLELVFSLPTNVVVKELAVLEEYGLVKKVDARWSATRRGLRLAGVWNAFHKQVEIEVQSSGRQWLLGPGEFAVDEMIRDKDEIEALARSYGTADAGSAVKFLEERRRAAEEFEAFVVAWPSRSYSDTANGEFAETLVFNLLTLAETDEALARLEGLLITHIGEVVDRVNKTVVAAVHTENEGKLENAAATIHKRGNDLMKKFENERRFQRRLNQNLAKIKMTCEAILVGQWLSANFGALVDAFNTEPAAFVFRSTVPFMQPEAPEKPTAKRAPNPTSATRPKQEEEGGLRSLFRWLFG